MQVEIIRNLEQLIPLREAWNAAVTDSNFDSVFVSHEWFYCWAKNFLADHELLVPIVRDDNKIAGIFPLLLTHEKHGPFKLTTLRSITNKQSYKYNFIVSRTNTAEIISAMFRHINREIPWTKMVLDFIPAPSDNLPLLQQMQGRAFYRMRTDIQMESPYVTITGTWDEYIAKRDKKVRKNWDYFERKLEKEGTTELNTVSTGQDLQQAIDTALDIEKSSWKGDKGTAIANSESRSSFYADLASAMSESDKFRLYFLNLNGQSIAFDYCLIHNDQFNVLKTGYNPEYSKSSPGRVLRKKILRDLFDSDKYKTYDLLGARDNWKTEWTSDTQTLQHVYIYNRRPVAILWYAATALGERLKDIVRRYPGLYSTIKKILSFKKK